MFLKGKLHGVKGLGMPAPALWGDLWFTFQALSLVKENKGKENSCKECSSCGACITCDLALCLLASLAAMNQCGVING